MPTTVIIKYTVLIKFQLLPEAPFFSAFNAKHN